MKHRLVVMSVDALTNEDIPFLCQLENFQTYLKGGACVHKTRSVYPSITYPAHVAISTGCYPATNGIFSNIITMNPNPNGEWFWYSNAIQREDIFTAAKKAGYTVGTSAWPVTSRHDAIDYLMPEYWIHKPYDSLRQAYTEHGASEPVLSLLEEHSRLLKHGKDPAKPYMKGKSSFTIYPCYDLFNNAVACDVIRRYKPEVMFVHWSIVDSWRHRYGVFNAKITAALAQADLLVGQIAEALEDAGVLEDTNLVLLSDHGQMDFTRRVKLNVLLADGGFLRVNEDDTIADDWQAYALSNGMSAYVFVKNGEGSEDYTKVRRYLDQLCEEGIYGFSRVMTRQEAIDEYHLDGDFAFILETDDYTSFSDATRRPILAGVDLSDYRYGAATHGYMPEKGPQPVFYAKGPDFRSGAVLEQAELVDIAPTLAEVLEIRMPQAEGRVLSELLK